MSTLEQNENIYEPDIYFRQPDGKVVQQELTTYELDNGVMTRRTTTRRFTNGDYIDSYSSTPLVRLDD